MKSKNLRQYKDEFIKLYNEGYSFRRIAEMYGVSKGAVGRYIKEGTELRVKGLTESQKQQVKGLYLEGLTVNAVADKLGLVYSTVKNYLSNEFGIVTNGNKKYAHLVDKVIKDYESGLNATEISEKYNISRQTVMNYVAESDVNARTYSEASRIYELNEDYFDNLDKEKSAILGMIFAKGRAFNNLNNYCVDINVHESKRNIVNIILKKLYSGDAPKFNYIDNNIVSRISSKNLYAKLNEYGLYNKGDKNVFERVPDGVDEESFWKGYIYASCTINTRHLYINGNPNEIKVLQAYLNKLGITNFRKCNTGISIENKKEIKKLIEEFNFHFIKELIEEYVDNLESGTQHSWSFILTNKRRPRKY